MHSTSRPFGEFMFYACGLPEQNLFVGMGIEKRLINTVSKYSQQGVDKHHNQALTFTHMNQLLYTVFQQVLETISSVNQSLVHIIHSTYKEHHELKKGIK